MRSTELEVLTLVLDNANSIEVCIYTLLCILYQGVISPRSFPEPDNVRPVKLGHRHLLIQHTQILIRNLISFIMRNGVNPNLYRQSATKFHIK